MRQIPLSVSARGPQSFAGLYELNKEKKLVGDGVKNKGGR